MDGRTLIVYYQQVYPELVECVGSGSIIIPDQRFSVLSLVKKVIKREYVRPPEAKAFGIAWGSIMEHNLRTEPILFVNYKKN